MTHVQSALTDLTHSMYLQVRRLVMQYETPGTAKSLLVADTSGTWKVMPALDRRRTLRLVGSFELRFLTLVVM